MLKNVFTKVVIAMADRAVLVYTQPALRLTCPLILVNQLL